jgi:hypothetical protein
MLYFERRLKFMAMENRAHAPVPIRMILSILCLTLMAEMNAKITCIMYFVVYYSEECITDLKH